VSERGRGENIDARERWRGETINARERYEIPLM